MALSSAERERRQNIDKTLKSLIDVVPEDEPIVEASDNRIRDLRTLESLVNQGALGYDKMGVFPAVDPSYPVSVAVFFIPTKKVKVAPNDNCLSYSFAVSGQDLWVQSLGNPTTLEDFMELPKTVEGDNPMTIEELVDKCDADAIYNAYQSRAMSIMQMYASTAYSMFNGSEIFKRMEHDRYDANADGTVQRIPDGNTLYVTYDPRMGKFKYSYNPRFVLKAAIEEYNTRRDKYESLEACYTYILTFFITHEMMHIITNNTSNVGGGVSEVDLGSHKIENQIQDSFINCQLSLLFNRVDGVVSKDGEAPMPSVGINSKISVRAEHNVGFKHFKNAEDLAKELAKIFAGTLKMDNLSLRLASPFTNKSLEHLEGADIFVQVEVSPRMSTIRKNSIIYQKFVNDIIRTITDGKIYDRFEKRTEAEKLTDADVLPNGTLVRIKGSVEICVITGYDRDTMLYTLNKTNEPTVKKQQQKDGSYLCAYEYSDSGNLWGTALRCDFKPFDPASHENTWVEGSAKTPKTSLADFENPDDPKMPKEMQDLLQKMLGGQQGQDQSAPQEAPKSFNIGDVVYIRTLNCFGRITSISNGKFEIEEMREEPPRILDDSNFH